MKADVTELFADLPGEQSSLFVIWANGRHREKEIIRDLNERFDVLNVSEVTWSPNKVAENFQRFYADIDVRGIYHRFSKGPGPFIAITVVDRSPVMEERETSRGPRIVNGRFIDAKTLYRAWAGELAVHCTENAWETDRDVFMLFGVGMQQNRNEIAGRWSGEITKVIRDVTGAHGWSSEKELFGALNRAVEYVMVTGPDRPPFLGKDTELNLLAADGRALHTVLRAQPKEPASAGGSFRVPIGQGKAAIGLRNPQDGFFPAAFAWRILRSRKLAAGGVFVPDEREAFGALAYHELMHRRAPERVTFECLLSQAEKLGIAGWTSTEAANPQALRSLLRAELAQAGEDFTRPLDADVYFNRSIAGLDGSWPVTGAAVIARNFMRLQQRAKYSMRSLYWDMRDRLLIAAPGLRTLKRRLTG